MVVVHSYKYGYGGLGDLLRSMLAYFVFCKQNNIDYYLDFSETSLSHCFDNRMPQKYRKIHNPMLFIQMGSKHNQDTLKKLETIKEGSKLGKLHLIYSNIFDFIPIKELKKHTKEFSEFLIYSDKVINRSKELLETLSLNNNEYVGIHTRCGDAHMEKKNIESDSRITPNASVSKVEKAVAFLKNLYPSTDIVLFTDNKNLKNKSILLGTSVFNTKITHTAMANDGTDSFIDSVAEFYLLSNSKCVVSVKDSGFSYWSTFISGTPIYKLDNEDNVVIFETLSY